MRHRLLAVDENRVGLVGDVLLDGHPLVLQTSQRLLGFGQSLHQRLNRLAQLMHLLHEAECNNKLSK